MNQLLKEIKIKKMVEINKYCNIITSKKNEENEDCFDIKININILE